MVILSGTACPLSSISLIISTTFWRASGSVAASSLPPSLSSGMIIHPFLPPMAGRMAKLSSPIDLLTLTGLVALAGVEQRDPWRDPCLDPCLEP